MERDPKVIVSKIKAAILAADPSAEVFLFGSRARGEEHKNSDWDVLVLVPSDELSRDKEMAFREALFDVELELGIPISTFAFAKKNWEGRHSSTPLYRNIKNEAVLL